MATLRELIIKISANSQSFQSEIARASRMGSDYYRIMEQGGRRSAAATRETSRSLSDLNAQLATVRTSALGMAGAFAGAFATDNLIRMADGYNSLSARVKLATTDAQDFAIAQRGLMDISQRTGSALADNAALFSRASSSLREWGFGTQDILKLTDALANGLQVSGASAEETSSMIVQLSQALGRGVLRGQDFNSVAQSGQRVMKALSDGMGVAQKDLKGMADAGQLTTDKIVPALISQLGKLKSEFASMPNSVSAASTRISNAFMEWVGGANQATGATSGISGVMDSVAKNIDSVATAAGALVAVGLARYMGNIASGAISSSAGLITAAKNEAALAQAQVRGTQISTARARAAVYRAQQALAAARGTDAQAAAEKRLTAAHSVLTRNISARTTAQTNLNNVTSAGSRLMGGALGLIGGIPGLVMLGASAWFVMHQRQEQARESARAYIDTLNEVKAAASGMSLSQASDSEDKTRQSLAEQNRLIAEQSGRVRKLQSEVSAYQQMLAKPGPTVGGFMINNLMSLDDAAKGLESSLSSLAVEQERLSQMQARSQDIQDVLAGLEGRRVALIRQQASEQNVAYQSLLLMNVQHSELNRLLSVGNGLLSSREGMSVAAPFRVSQAEVNDKDQDALLTKQQNAELAGLTGLAKARRQAEFDLQKMGRTGPENATYAGQYRKAIEEEYLQNQKLAEAKKANSSATKEQEKAEHSAARIAEEYSRKIDDLSVAVDVQKVRANEGEKAADLYAAANQTGAKWTDEQRKAIRASAEELAKWTQRADDNVRKQHEQADALRDLTDAARKFRDEATLTTETSGMSTRQRSQFDETQQINRVFVKTDRGTEAFAQRGAALDALDKKYKAISAAEADWMSGVSRGYANWFDEISDVSGTVSDGVKTTMDSAFSNVTSMLEGNKVSWRSWGISVLQIIEKVALQMAVVSAMGRVSSGSGIFGSLVGSVGSFFGGGSGAAASTGTAVSSYGANLQFNAKGGVYDSPSLSAFSNGIVRNPTMFAFAKGGAGIMGEAGPEAIMPLTRAPDGSLGVRAVGAGGSQSVSSAPQVYITIDGNGNTSTTTSAGLEQFGADVGRFVDQRYKQNVMRDISPGGDIWNAMKGTR
ncbi:phage tail tape measure protein [Enterobacteriaceae bacterium H4N4]|uniref:Phage tail tape measure protein n=1 Tax=Silvania confinis TaxID=2926470 RepID=A0A9J6QK04_9ENTR|nr:phage tail tape measure protein [Silvania confinis]MCU6671172.1 phage tail tape measure protein [Silvania confinis]